MPISALLYADDLALVAHSNEALEVLVKLCEAHSLRHRYRFNPTKCVAFETASLTMYGEPIPVLPKFKYLRVMFQSDGVDWTGDSSNLKGNFDNLKCPKASGNFFGPCPWQLGAIFIRLCVPISFPHCSIDDEMRI